MQRKSNQENGLPSTCCHYDIREASTLSLTLLKNIQLLSFISSKQSKAQKVKAWVLGMPKQSGIPGNYRIILRMVWRLFFNLRTVKLIAEHPEWRKYSERKRRMMRLCLNTDGLGHLPFEEMVKTSAEIGIESLEIACGNWSNAPHMALDGMLQSASAREKYMDTIR